VDPLRHQQGEPNGQGKHHYDERLYFHAGSLQHRIFDYLIRVHYVGTYPDDTVNTGMTWRYLEIQRPNITHFDFAQIRGDRVRPEWNQYNIIHPEADPHHNGTRQDAHTSILSDVWPLAQQNPTRQFLLILDQGEVQPWDQSQLPGNLQVFKRRFTWARYNFHGAPPPREPVTPRRWIYCPMGRADWIRTRWFDLLVQHHLLPHNRVSYLCTNFPAREPDPEQYTATGGTGNKHLLPHNTIEDTVLDNVSRHQPNWNAIRDCVFGVSVETGSTSAEAWYNERIYNILAAGVIPVVLAGSGALGQLENLGFRIPDYINWRLWDQWPVDQWGTGVDKMKQTAQALEKFCDSHSIQDIVEDWRPHSQHNQRHWQRLVQQQDLEDQQVLEWVLTVTHNLNSTR